MEKIRGVQLITLLLIITGCTLMTETTPTPTPLHTTDIETLLAQMTLEEKIGQLFIVGLKGSELDRQTQELLEKYHVGGIILFARNLESPQQIAELTNALQAMAHNSGHPGLFMSIDQEGGRVARLTEAIGFTEFPSPMAIAATGNVDNARQIAQAMAAEMKAVGFNVNFAPVLDVNNNPANPVIGTRSFGSDPQRVAEFGVAYLEGLQSAGMLAFGKHFPGHGDTGVDSHVSLPVVPHDRERLESVEFVPFQAAMAQGIAGIMSAHVTFPAIDPTPGLPATLSAPVLTGLLRQEMGYEGLVITDALEMGALGASGYPEPLAAAMALQAGADLLLFGRGDAQPKAAQAMILDWVQSGKIPESRLDEAVRRVLHAKQQFGLLLPTPVSVAAVAAAVYTEAHRSLSRTVAAQAITLVRDEAHLLPVAAGTELLVVETAPGRGLGRALQTTFIEVGANPSNAEIRATLAMANGRTTIMTIADVAQNPQQLALVAALQEAGYPVIVVAVRSPYDLLALPPEVSCLTSYGFNPPMVAALTAVFTTQLQPQGQLPIH